jgi:hypothetical protein
VITPRGHNILSKVSDLIDPITGSWGNELLVQTFWGGGGGGGGMSKL